MYSLSKVEVKNKIREVKPWVRRFGRLGYLTKGVVYAMIGVLAALAAFGPSGDTTGKTGALQSIAEMPFGEVALWVIGVGLIGYIVWDVIKVIKDPEDDGLIKRAGSLISAVIYTNLAFGALKLASHTGYVDVDDSGKTISAKLIEQPFGVWIVGLVGAIIISYGVYEIYSGSKEKFMSKFQTAEMHNKELKIARISGKLGLISRGIVLSMVGFFFIRTAYTLNPEESKGLGGALTELANQPFGQSLLAIVAVGLILYGVYQMIRGFYQHMSYGHEGK